MPAMKTLFCLTFQVTLLTTLLPVSAQPGPPYNDAVAARFPAPAQRYETPGLQPGRSTFTSNDELAAFVAALARTPGVRRLAPGLSQRGTPIEALHFSRGPGRPVVLLVGQQHGDEPAGSEALLVVARELAGGSLAPLLDRIDVLVLPRANPDGAEFGQRVSVNGNDINRDHLLLRTPEAAAQAALVREFAPQLVVDAHEHTVVGRYLEKFGAIQRYDMLLQYAMTANLPPALTQASETMFFVPLRQALDRERLSHEWYYTNPTTPGDLRLSMGGVQPDTARNVQGLKNAVSVLLESRGVGIGRLHAGRRVHSHVVAVRSLLQSAADNAVALLALRQTLAQQVGAAACEGQVTVLATQTPLQRELLMLDPETGADKAVAVQWNSSLALRPLVMRPRPCGYWLAADAADPVARLRALGVAVQQLPAALDLRAETWRETARGEAERGDVRGRIADSQTIVQVTVATEATTLAAPAGSFYIGLDQPLANLVVAALEPDTQNSYFANRLLPSLRSAARVLQRPDFSAGATRLTRPEASPERRE